MPKNADGIDNILFHFENESQSYRAGTDMVGKVIHTHSSILVRANIKIKIIKVMNLVALSCNHWSI